MNLIHPLAKIEKGWINEDRSLMSDSDCEWYADVEAAWRKTNPKLTDFQARKLFNLLPPPEAFRGSLDRDTILERVDMQRLMEQYCLPPYRQYGDRMTVRCPWHQDTRPSMTVWLSAKRVWCFVCNEGGSAIDLCMRSDNLTFLPALRRLNELFP